MLKGPLPRKSDRRTTSSNLDAGRGTGYVHAAEVWLLLAEHQALDGNGAAGGSVAVDEQSAHPSVPACGLELAWHSTQKSLDYKLFLHTDNAVVGSAHAYVGLVCGAVW